MLYVYGNENMIVGRLTDDEVGFLISSGSRVLAVQGGLRRFERRLRRQARAIGYELVPEVA